MICYKQIVFSSTQPKPLEFHRFPEVSRTAAKLAGGNILPIYLAGQRYI